MADPVNPIPRAPDPSSRPNIELAGHFGALRALPVFPFNDERVFHHELVPDMGGTAVLGHALVTGASAGIQQRDNARRKSGSTFVMQPNLQDPNGLPVNYAAHDMPGLQQFPQRPDLRQLLPDAPVNQGPVTLPGRQPPAGWDGEPGFTAPAPSREL